MYSFLVVPFPGLVQQVYYTHVCNCYLNDSDIFFLVCFVLADRNFGGHHSDYATRYSLRGSTQAVRVSSPQFVKFM